MSHCGNEVLNLQFDGENFEIEGVDDMTNFEMIYAQSSDHHSEEGDRRRLKCPRRRFASFSKP
jgi:hypothetical protein